MNPTPTRPLRRLARACALTLAGLACAVSALAQNLQWRRVYEPGVGGAVVSLAISPHDRDTIVAGGDILGLARSTDLGVTWNQALAGLESYDYGDITWHPNPSTATRNTVWAASANGPHLSTDGGLTWTLKRSGFPANANQAFTAAVQVILYDPADSTRLLAFGGNRRDEDSNFYNGKLKNTGHVYVSDNHGESWTKLSEIVPGVTNDSANVLAAAYLAGSTSETILAAVKGRGVYRSANNGASWAAVNVGLPTTNVRHLVTHPSDPLVAWVALGSGQGVFKTTNGGDSWFASRTGLTLSDNYRHIAVSKSNPELLFTLNKGPKELFRSTDGGASWTQIPAPSAKAIDINYEAGQVAIDPVEPSRVFVSTWNSIFRSVDAGLSFQDLSSYRPDPAQVNNWRGRGYSGYVSLNFYWNPAFPDRSYTLAMDDGLWISNDNLKTWRSAVKSGLPAFGGYSDMSFSADGLTVYATRGQPGWALGHDIVKSTDGGLTWSRTTYPRSDRFSQWNFPRGVYVHPTQPDRVWVTVAYRLYYSEDGGASWVENPLDDTQPAGTGISNAGGRRLEYIAPRGGSNPTEFFVGGRRGVYHTTDGQNFTLLPGSPKNWEFGATRIRPDPTTPNRVYVVNWGYFEGSEGVWRGTFNTGTGNWSWTRLIGWGFITPNVKYLTDIAINPANPDQAVISTRKDGFEALQEGQGIYVTSNLTASNPSWTVQNTGLSMRRVNSVRFKPGNEGIIVAGTGGGGYYIAKWDGSVVDTGAGVAAPDNPGTPTPYSPPSTGGGLGPNLLATNPDFESNGYFFWGNTTNNTNVPGWLLTVSSFIGGGIESGALANKSGTRYGAIRGGGSWVTAPAARVAITPGVEYTLSALVAKTAANTSFSTPAQLQIQWFNGNASGSTLLGTASSGNILAGAATAGFQEFTVKGLPPSGATHAGVRFAFSRGTWPNEDTANFALDNVRLQKPSLAGSRLPVADTYVRAGTNASATYGGQTDLWVKLDTDASFTRETFLRFDVSGLANVGTARLVLPVVAAGTASTSLELAFISSDTWSENMNWNLRPTTANVLSTWTSGGAGTEVVFDLSSLVRNEAGDGALSLRVRSTVAGTERWVRFGSKENTDAALRPRLELED